MDFNINNISKSNHSESEELVCNNEESASKSKKKIKFGLKNKKVSKVDQDKVIKIEEPNSSNEQDSSEEKEIIPIPMINKNKYKTVVEDSLIDDLSKKALAELKAEAKQHLETSNIEDEKLDLTVPILQRNKVPEGFENGRVLDVSIRPENPDENDYSQVKIEDFGTALLLGMGMNKDKKIGKSFQERVVPVDVRKRPAGLGLGANAAMNPNLKGKVRKEDKINLGDFVQVVYGINKGRFGEVTGYNADLGRYDVLILPHPRESHSVNEFSLKKVTNNDYLSEEKRIEEESMSKVEEKKSKKRKDNGHGYPVSTKKFKKERKWITTDLRVRVVDKNLKYYKKKVDVIDVQYDGSCTCKTENGHVVDLHESQLETVIPKSSHQDVYIKITGGSRYRGHLGRILNKDKKKETVNVQLLENRDQVLTISYDDVCEYIGRVEDHYNY